MNLKSPYFSDMFNIMVRKLSTNTTITLSDDSFPMARVYFNNNKNSHHDTQLYNDETYGTIYKFIYI